MNLPELRLRVTSWLSRYWQPFSPLAELDRDLDIFSFTHAERLKVHEQRTAADTWSSARRGWQTPKKLRLVKRNRIA